VRLPVPRDTGHEGVNRYVLDESEHVAGPYAVLCTHWHERERAVSGDRRRDAMLWHRVEERVPPQRRVVVRVAIDEPRCDERSAGIDLLFTVGPQPGADLGNDAAAHT